MKRIRPAAFAAVAIAPALVFAAPAFADPDTDFTNELHTYGIYGQKDYKSTVVQQAPATACSRFLSRDYAGRRQYSEDTATDIYYEQMAFRWPNWAKLFINNKGVSAHGTDVCNSDPPADPSVWNW